MQVCCETSSRHTGDYAAANVAAHANEQLLRWGWCHSAAVGLLHQPRHDISARQAASSPVGSEGGRGAGQSSHASQHAHGSTAGLQCTSHGHRSVSRACRGSCMMSRSWLWVLACVSVCRRGCHTAASGMPRNAHPVPSPGCPPAPGSPHSPSARARPRGRAHCWPCGPCWPAWRRSPRSSCKTERLPSLPVLTGG